MINSILVNKSIKTKDEDTNAWHISEQATRLHKQPHVMDMAMPIVSAGKFCLAP